MKSNLLMDFVVDKENSKVKVKREFAEPKDTVWAAWTEPQLLDQWWAPKPWKSKTKAMNFTEGGSRLYAMVGPEGEEHWAWAEFQTITPKDNFTFKDAFCDEHGNLNLDFPRSQWSVDFTGSNGSTTVMIEIKHQSLADLEKIIEMGFKEGFTMALQNLDEIFDRS